MVSGKASRSSVDPALAASRDNLSKMLNDREAGA
jgi:hypothetical protein